MINLNKQNGKNYNIKIVGCLCVSDDNYLFLKRSETKRYPSYWCVPGGKVNIASETSIQAMTRELFEETGLIMSENELEYLYTYYIEDDQGDFEYTLYCVTFGKQPDVVLNENEHVDYIWEPLEEIIRLELVSDMREVLNHAKKLLRTPAQLDLFIPKYDKYRVSINNIRPAVSTYERKWYAAFGPPSSGKTTTLKEIAALDKGYKAIDYSKKILNTKTRLNYYLKKAIVYKERRFFFNFQMEVLALRFTQTFERNFIPIIDESIFSTLAYSIALRKLNWITENEFQTFMFNYNLLDKLIDPPAVIFYFKCDKQVMSKRLISRNRQIETFYTDEYIESLITSFYETAKLLGNKYLIEVIDTTNITPKDASEKCYMHIKKYGNK